MNEPLGQLPSEDASRDAIHIAIAPVVAGDILLPGEHIGFLSNGRVSGSAQVKIGVVDPFLKKPVPIGQRCFLLLYPGTATGLRHHWEHPAFESKPEPEPAPDTEVMKARRWLQHFASEVDLTLEDLLEACQKYLKNRITTCISQSDLDFADEQVGELWHYYSILTETRVNTSMVPFHCSCSC